MYSPSCYLPIPTQLGSNNLDFNGYNKIRPDIAHFEANFANFGAFGFSKPNEAPLGTPNQYLYVVCVVPVIIHLFHAMYRVVGSMET
jgi:hypothetical protein